jgi:hypothetical protein
VDHDQSEVKPIRQKLAIDHKPIPKPGLTKA